MSAILEDSRSLFHDSLYGVYVAHFHQISVLLFAMLAAGCHSFEVPIDYRKMHVEGIERVAFVGFDNLPNVEDDELRKDLAETFNDQLESSGSSPKGKDDYRIVFTNICFVFEAQHFSLNQFNPFSRDAYLFARDVEFGALYRFRVMRGDKEVLPETEFFHVADRLTYFERSSGYLWLITLTVFPYYDYYFYDGLGVAKSLTSRILEHMMGKTLPMVFDRKAGVPTIAGGSKGSR
jgi:hypothetical protein